jgi:hypothetical protein
VKLSSAAASRKLAPDAIPELATYRVVPRGQVNRIVLERPCRGRRVTTNPLPPDRRQRAEARSAYLMVAKAAFMPLLSFRVGVGAEPVFARGEE